jgi:hypothetical protein
MMVSRLRRTFLPTCRLGDLFAPTYQVIVPK